VRSGRTHARTAALAAHIRPVLDLTIPRGVGLIAAIAIIFASVAFGVARGGHLPAVVAQFHAARDVAANAAGFRIASIALSGATEVSREDILAAAGINGRASLLFFDADAARAQVKENPWIAEATILKLYPDRLQIDVREREAFALWQEHHKVRVIAADGNVVATEVAPRFMQLPLVVGHGAAARASEFLTLLDHHPQIREQVRAAILVAERRWNLRLKNGIDVRLPEIGVEAALDRLVALDRDKKLLSRDIVAVDLRLTDRVTVRLTDEAAAARAEALKDKTTKRKGSDA
jgi:cell division protein FtsQ